MPTTGAPRQVAASEEISQPGGSWTWTTSGANARSSRRSLVTPPGNGLRLETEPLAPMPTVRASGTRKSGRSISCGMRSVKRPAEPVGRIPGSHHPELVPPAQELRGKRLDMPVHPSRIGPGVRRDYGDTHRAKPSCSAPVLDVNAVARIPAARAGRSWHAVRRRGPIAQKKPAADREVDRPEDEQHRAGVVGDGADEDAGERRRGSRSARRAPRGSPNHESTVRRLGDRGDQQQRRDGEQLRIDRVDEGVGHQPQPPREDVGDVAGVAGAEHRAAQVRAAEDQVDREQRRERERAAADDDRDRPAALDPERQHGRRAGSDAEDDRGADVGAEPARGEGERRHDGDGDERDRDRPAREAGGSKRARPRSRSAPARSGSPRARCRSRRSGRRSPGSGRGPRARSAASRRRRRRRSRRP